MLKKKDNMSVILKAENISKQYRLGVVGTGTISHDLNRWWASLRGKEDPYLKVGAVNDRSTKSESDYVWALKAINFEVQQGEVLGIIGKNGAGKSTLLKILSRVTIPTTGEIKTKGRIASLLEVGTGFHPELTGRENMYLNGAILGMSKAEIKAKEQEIIAFSGCERYVDTPTKRYSSGMRVRLAFAVAAFLEPDILVIDEVLAVGDAEFQKKAIGKMQDISKGEGRTVLFVSHNMAAVKSLCTRAIVLENGKKIFEGSTEECITAYLKLGEVNVLKSNIGEIKERKGGDKLRFKSILFEDFEGNSIVTPLSGMKIKVRILFDTKVDFKNVEFRLQFQDVHGYLVSTLNNYHTNGLFNINKDCKEVVCEIEKFPLINGAYNSNLRAINFDGKEILDEVNECFTFNVEKGDFYQTGKIPSVRQGVLFDHKWSISGK